MKRALLLLAAHIIVSIAIAQPVVSFQSLATGLSQPVDVVSANDGANRLFVVERAGTIRIFTGSSVIATPFLNITSLVKSTGSEQGLLSLAFHPNYSTNGYFFVYYTNTDGNVTLARYSRSSLNTADPSSGVILMTIYKPFANHNGGKLNFGTDGYLYFGTGDGGSGGDPLNRAQNGDSILGKIVRIDINNPNPPYYSIPPTNPYLSNSAIRDDIIALGLRNPWRWSFDKLTGDMWIADVGQDNWEEVNYVPAANILDRNYGWRCYEATHVYNASCSAQPNNVVPVFEYPHNNTNGGFSITGGYRYRGSEYPFFQGYYICADYVSGKGWLVFPNGSGGWNSTMQTWMTGISSFGEDINGNLFATTLSGGLYKVVAADALPVKLTSFTGKAINGKHQLSFTVQGEERGDQYIIESRTNINAPFAEVYSSTAVQPSTTNSYTILLNPAAEKTYYRLKIISTNQQVHYSQVIQLNDGKTAMVKAYRSGGDIIVSYPAGSSTLIMYDAVGKIISRQALAPASMQSNIAATSLPKGVLTIRVLSGEDWLVTRLLY